MPADRTVVTELATALGMMGHAELPEALARRPAALRGPSPAEWDRLQDLWDQRHYREEFLAGFRNGRAFLADPDALRDREPAQIQWTGGRRPPGDEVVPAGLCVDHVYLVSCKYLSQVLQNPSPARLFEGLLVPGSGRGGEDWYRRVAPETYDRLYASCREAIASDLELPGDAAQLTKAQRWQLRRALQPDWPAGAEEHYHQLCQEVSQASAKRWQDHLAGGRAEVMLWRLLRIGSAPYFILGASGGGSMRLRIATPWDWRQSFQLRHFEVTPQDGGQPRVGWTATYRARDSREDRVVRGHVEVRWSHGRFAQPPEAKVYLDTPHEQVPGYHPLGGDGPDHPAAALAL